MIEFKINGNEWKIDKVTIQNYYDIYTKLATVNAMTQLEIVSALSGCPIEDLKLLDQLQFGQLWAELVNGPLDNTDVKFHKHIELDGKLYGFLDIKKLTIGEIADMDVLARDPRHQQQLHKMMAILYRPAVNVTDDWIVVEEYKAEDVEERAKTFLNLPIDYVHGAIAFFLTFRKYSFDNILNSLVMTEEMTPEEQEMIKITKDLMYELLETGITPSSFSQEEAYSKLMRLQDLASTMPSTSSPIVKQKPRKERLSMIGKWLKRKPVQNK